MSFKTIFTFVLFVMLLSSSLVTASLPQPVGYVNDFANVIDQRSQAEISIMGEQLQSEHGVEIAVVTIDTIEAFTSKEYAVELFNEWGIGGPEDSGLLILLALQEKRLEIEVGYGLEPILPDGKVGAILDRVIVPLLSEGEYGKGLLAGILAFQQELSGESFEQAQSEGDSGWYHTFIIFLIIAVLLTWQARRRPPNSGRPSSRNGGSFHRPRIPFPRSRGGGKGGFGGFGGGSSGGGGAGRNF